MHTELVLVHMHTKSVILHMHTFLFYVWNWIVWNLHKQQKDISAGLPKITWKLKIINIREKKPL